MGWWNFSSNLSSLFLDTYLFCLRKTRKLSITSPEFHGANDVISIQQVAGYDVSERIGKKAILVCLYNYRTSHNRHSNVSLSHYSNQPLQFYPATWVTDMAKQGERRNITHCVQRHTLHQSLNQSSFSLSSLPSTALESGKTISCP